jgi:putative acetyltransferase
MVVPATSLQRDAPRLAIRSFEIGDAAPLRAVFFSSVHDLTGGQYTPAQRAAWAPLEYDRAAWAARLAASRPFLVEIDGCVAGFADLQSSGYIDHFYVAGNCAGRGPPASE